MTSLSLDCKDARKELEISKRQVEDLKRQLQHYVAEVKRTEDLISQKVLKPHLFKIVGLYVTNICSRNWKEQKFWTNSGTSVKKTTSWKPPITLWKAKRRKLGCNCL